MTLAELTKLWEADAKIDPSDLATEALKISQLHHKYYFIHSAERIKCNQLEVDLAVLKLARHDFLHFGATEETKAKGWVLPPQGRIMTTKEREPYVDTSPDVIELSLKIGIYNEKLQYLKSIQSSLATRGYAIHNAIEFMKMQNGIN